MAKQSSQVNRVEDEDDSDTDLSVLNVETVSTLSTVLGKGKQVITELTFCVEDNDLVKHKTSMVCQLDTGASCNVISYRDLTVLLQNSSPTLNESSVKLKMYDGSIMRPLGETHLPAVHNGICHTLEFQVVNTSNKPLLSAESCQALGRLQFNLNPPQTVHAVESQPTPLSKEDILSSYKYVFDGLGRLGNTTLMTDNTVKPVQHTPRRVPVALRLSDLEKRGIICKVTEPTERISSMVIIAKPGKLRISLDPRDLSKALKRPKYQMPTSEEALPQLAKAKVFSTLDAKDGFYQISLDEQSSLKTTFWTPFGRYRYLRMPFGVSVAPEEFERSLHEKLDGLPGTVVIRDDVLVMGQGDTHEQAVADHDSKLRRLLQREVNLKLNKATINLRQTEVHFMGHVVTSQGLKPDPGKVKAVEEMPSPTCKKELSSLLGFVNYLSKFLPRLSKLHTHYVSSQ